MAQADLVVANQSGAAFRSDLNGQLLALGTLQSGASAPSVTYSYMFWADTTAGLLKIRDAANAAWITVGTLASANLGLATVASPTFTGTVTIPAGASISGYAPLASPTFTGTVTIPAGASITGYAPLASPTLTGTPAAPTATTGTNTTQLATTAYVVSQAVAKTGATMTGDITFASTQPQVCKAWVNFNGTGTVAIRASYNVSSITDNGVGDYTVNFTTALADQNYATQFTVRNDAIAAFGWVTGIQSATDPTTTAVRLVVYRGSDGTARDTSIACVAIFR